MRILQLNNTASVPLTIARYLRNLDYEVDVIHPIFSRLDDEHIRGVTDASIVGGDRLAITNFLTKHGGEYDVIHVHAIMEYLPFINQMHPNIPIVYTGHGRDVRERWHIPYVQQFLQFAKYITVSTKDLLDGSPEYTHYLPNVPDPIVWVRKAEPIERLAFYKYFNREDVVDEARNKKEAEAYAHRNGWTLIMQNRANAHIPYIKYPRYVEKFGVFLDFRYLNPHVYKNIHLPLSYTAIQFLSLGNNKVVHYFDKEYTELPKEFNYSKVMNEWEKIYNKVI